MVTSQNDVVVVEAGRSYFDTNISDHHHFFYESNGRLCDIPSDTMVVGQVPPPPPGTRIARVEVIIRLAEDSPASPPARS